MKPGALLRRPAATDSHFEAGGLLPDPESAIRRRMRLHPAGPLVSSHPEVEPEVTPEDLAEPRVSPTPVEPNDRTPIVSINGEDVDLDTFIHKHCA
jgi:hypothetical protein